MGLCYFQVSSIVKMENDDVMTPPWLTPMLRADYFVTCSIHSQSSKSECNLFCLDCSGNAFCSSCLAHHRTHRVIQVWFSIFHYPSISQEFCRTRLFNEPNSILFFFCCYRFDDRRIIMW